MLIAPSPLLRHDQTMKPLDKARSLAAIELADALIADFNNPSSALKGIGRETMEKLLIYLKIAERSQRRQSKKAPKAPDEVVAEDEEA